MTVSEIINKKYNKYDKKDEENKNYKRKFNNDQIREIRNIYENETDSIRDIAKIYNVSPETISRIINNKSYKYVV